MPMLLLVRAPIVVLLATVLAACASTAGKPAAPAAVDDAALDAMYREIEQQAERFRTAAPRVEDGLIAGERAAALAELRAAADRCAAMPGCRIGRVIDVYAGLLQLDELPGAVTDEALLAEDRLDSSPVLDDVPEAGRSMNLLNGRELGDVIALNGPVKAALNEWLTWMRPNLVEAWENYQYMRHRMWPEYQQAGLPEALLFGILAKESGGKVHAVSRAGAAGPLQFMPATGLRLGLGRGPDGFDARFDPASAARANVRYLNERFREFNHDLALSLAAYNGGEGRVSRLVRRAGRVDFWDPSIRGALPVETRDYVPMVLAAAWLFLHPEQYGLEFPPVDTQPAELQLARDTSINELAICLGNAGSRNGWFRALRNLNPRFQTQQKLSTGTTLAVPAVLLDVYRNRCIDGPAATLAAEIAGAAMHHPTQVAGAAMAASYTVRSGDSLASIARRHHCSVPSLARANGIKAPRYLIRAGQKLRLQGCRG